MKYYDILLAEDYRGRYIWKVMEDADEYTNPIIMEEGVCEEIDEAYKAAKAVLEGYVHNRMTAEDGRIEFNDGTITAQSEET